MALNYRKEIDGLRALAILPVILFHAGFPLFKGGFIGVDIFFVISGYLITSLIIKEKKENHFSLVSFYERRARRILPALFFMMLISFVFSLFILLPSEMKSFSKSILRTALLTSNILFYRQDNYFNSVSELKPLLHTWSLSIEEQYYLIFPFILICIWHFKEKRVFLCLLTIFFCSLFYAQYQISKDSAAAFYLLPSRFWELLIGSLSAFLSFKSEEENMAIANLASIAGLIMILSSIFLFDLNTPHPSIRTLLPTIGAALVILFAKNSNFTGKILSNNFITSIGLISYSLYLWHQPIFAFIKLKNYHSADVNLLAILITITIAYISWRYIEQPLRNKNKFSRENIFKLTILGSVFFILIGLIGNLTNLFEYRFTKSEREIFQYSKYGDHELIRAYKYGSCFLKPDQDFNSFSNDCLSINNQNISLIWGDSFAASLSFGLKNINQNVSQYTASGCPPFKNISIQDRKHCKEINNFVLDQIKKYQFKNIYLSAHWKRYKNIDIKENLEQTLSYIQKISPSTKIIIIGSFQEWQPSLPIFIFKNNKFLNDEFLLENILTNDIALIDEIIARAANENNAEFFSVRNALCIKNNCQASISYNNIFMPIAWDFAHLTEAGSVLLATKITKH